MGFLVRRRLRRAIRSYACNLPALLRRDYGAGQWHLPKQVQATVERSGLSLEHLPYALLMFSDPVEFERCRRETGMRPDLGAMRRDVGPAHFHDDSRAADMLGPLSVRTGGPDPGGNPGGDASWSVIGSGR